MPSFYKILGVVPTATNDEILLAFNRLIRQAESMYGKEVRTSTGEVLSPKKQADRLRDVKEVLMDKAKRKQYDKEPMVFHKFYEIPIEDTETETSKQDLTKKCSKGRPGVR